MREGRRPDGQPYLDSVRSALRGIAFLEPGLTARFAFEASPGALSGVSSDTDAGFLLQVGPQPATEAAAAPDLYRHRLSAGAGHAGSGPVALEIETRPPAAACSRFSRFPRRRGSVSAFRSLSYRQAPADQPDVQSLFRSEVVGGAQGLAIRDIALFTDIRGSTALYQRIGDLNAFQLVQQHFDLLRETTVRHGGAIVKTIGDAIMAAYPDAALAVGAALEMRGAIERFNEAQPERPVSLKIGIHHGAAIAVTLNDELDYFGQTVNIASRVQEMADAEEIWITEDVWRYLACTPSSNPSRPRSARPGSAASSVR